MKDVLIVGGSVAGMSAALLLARCRRSVIVCDAGNPRNRYSRSMHGFLSREGITPEEFARISREQVAAFPNVELRRGTVAGISRDHAGHFIAVTGEGERFESRTVLLATGIIDELPPIPGFEELYGISIHHCPYCDGLEHSDQPLAVYGAGDSAVELAEEMLQWSRDVIYCSDGVPVSAGTRERLEYLRIPIRDAKIGKLVASKGKLRRIDFLDGTELERSAIFFTSSQRQNCDLPQQLGCDIRPDGFLSCVEDVKTNISGVFAAGNDSAGLQLAIVAAAEGARAAYAINTFLSEHSSEKADPEIRASPQICSTATPRRKGMEQVQDRIAGVLVPVFSLRSPGCLGIGDTEALKEFIDWAATCGFGVVKLLPINETGSDHSPYSAISSHALEPSLLRVDPQTIPGLTPEAYRGLTQGRAEDSSLVDYSVVKPLKLELLKRAFANFDSEDHAFNAFLKTETWLGAYTLYRVLVDENLTERWDTWPEYQRTFDLASQWLASLSSDHRARLDGGRRFYTFVQWVAATQWKAVKRHAELKGIKLMGDIPFGVNFCSAEVWSHPELFQLDWSGGTPPEHVFKHDPFVQKWGQNWGIPLYNWDALRAEDHSWWRERVRATRDYFDLIRIDHVLGFYRIYGFPWRPERNHEFFDLSLTEAALKCDGKTPRFHPRPDDTEENKSENRSDGESYLKVILAEFGPGRVVGEDLGTVPDYVRPSLASLGIAGYKVPQWEKDADGHWTPGEKYERLSLATYATHDHEPLRSWWERLILEAESSDSAKQEIAMLLEFAGFDRPPPQNFSEELHESLLRALFASNSWLAVVMVTDAFGRPERFNFPGVAGTANWTLRLHDQNAALSRSRESQMLSRLLAETGRT